jgi:uncharacterized protein YndB with AHSA1/START domain
MALKVKLQRDFAATPDMVFRSIYDGTLFACCGFAPDTMKIDFQVGGKYRMQYKNDPEVTGEFLEIIPNQKAVFTWSEENTKVTITVNPREAGSLVMIEHEGLPDTKWFERFKGGWTSCLNHLTKKLAL